MRKILLVLGMILLGFGCMPLANSVSFDIYSNYDIIYNKDVMIKDQFPPEVLKVGEGFVMYMGKSDKTLWRQKHTLIYVDQYVLPIKDKVNVPNGTVICVEVNNNGKTPYARYVLISGRKYIMSMEQ